MEKDRNKRLLGITCGKARNILVKSLLFDMATQLNKNRCFQCHEIIENVDEFSIEHNVSWQANSDPSHCYFDLNNISFSHLSCNASGKKNRTKHIPWNKKYSSEEERIKEKNKRARISKKKYRERNRLRLREQMKDPEFAAKYKERHRRKYLKRKSKG